MIVCIYTMANVVGSSVIAEIWDTDDSVDDIELLHDLICAILITRSPVGCWYMTFAGLL